MTWNDSPQDQPSPSSASWGQPRRLERRRDGKVLGGVCAGIADYFNIDVTLVRLVAIILALATGVAVPAYLVAWLVVPLEGSEQSEFEKLVDRSGLGRRPTDHQAA
jgi:phage shock protein PspC (stress-responsive transcriptional regulator)